ncbi:hypothetical protein [Actinomadura kijaniata]|uniref:hypothetical protein n=1 Tax=Actinomadura kijaniata TaxID=46161 RepID=UPI0012F9047E|nr:hypothetical protein [Actinomadura kijaniata]
MAVVLTLVAAGGGAGCQDGSGGERPKSGPRTSAAVALPEVPLPDDPKALATLVNEKVGALPSVRVSVNTTTVTNQGKASVALWGTVRNPSGQRTAASFKVVETGGPEPGTSETVVLDGAVYLKNDGGEYEPGRPWLRVTREDLTRPGIDETTRKTFASAFEEAQQGLREAAATRGLTALQDGALIQEPVWEQLEGTQVRRYSGKTEAASLRQSTDRGLRALAEAGVTSVPWVVWVDRRGLLRQFSATVASGPTSMDIKAVYSGWGEPVNVTPPPERQTATLG